MRHPSGGKGAYGRGAWEGLFFFETYVCCPLPGFPNAVAVLHRADVDLHRLSCFCFPQPIASLLTGQSSPLPRSGAVSDLSGVRKPQTSHWSCPAALQEGIEDGDGGAIPRPRNVKKTKLCDRVRP